MPDSTPIHGTVSRLGVPTAIERDGHLQRVVVHTPRLDLDTAFCERGVWRAIWEVELQDGARLTVYHDLTSGGWYELAAAELADIHQDAAKWAQKLREYEASRPAAPA